MSPFQTKRCPPQIGDACILYYEVVRTNFRKCQKTYTLRVGIGIKGSERLRKTPADLLPHSTSCVGKGDTGQFTCLFPDFVPMLANMCIHIFCQYTFFANASYCVYTHMNICIYTSTCIHMYIRVGKGDTRQFLCQYSENVGVCRCQINHFLSRWSTRCVHACAYANVHVYVCVYV